MRSLEVSATRKRMVLVPDVMSAPTSVSARGHHAVERRRHLGEGLELPQPRHVRLRGGHGRLLGGSVADLLVRLLRRHGIGLQQRLPALRRALRELAVGLAREQIGLGLVELVVDVGRVELGQELALLHRRADIGVPALHIAAGAGIDRRLEIRLHIAGQHHLLGLGAFLDRRDDDARDRLGLGRGAQCPRRLPAGAKPPDDEHQHDRDGDQHARPRRSSGGDPGFGLKMSSDQRSLRDQARDRAASRRPIRENTAGTKNSVAVVAQQATDDGAAGAHSARRRRPCRAPSAACR
jgi:hypothetical protein